MPDTHGRKKSSLELATLGATAPLLTQPLLDTESGDGGPVSPVPAGVVVMPEVAVERLPDALTNINEKTYVRLISLGAHPNPEGPGWTMRALKFVKSAGVEEYLTTTRSMQYAFLLGSELMVGGLLLFKPNLTPLDVELFVTRNEGPRFIFSVAVGAVCVLMLHSPCLMSRETAATAITTLNNMLTTSLSAGTSWISYLNDISAPSILVDRGFFPASAVGFIGGFFIPTDKSKPMSYDVSSKTTLKVVYHSVSSALSIGSMFHLGVYPIVNACWLSEGTKDLGQQLVEIDATVSMVQLVALSTALIANLARHPSASPEIKMIGSYFANSMNALSFGLVDACTQTSLLTVFAMLIDPSMMVNSPGSIAIYCSLMSVVYLMSIFLAWANTPELPEFDAIVYDSAPRRRLRAVSMEDAEPPKPGFSSSTLFYPDPKKQDPLVLPQSVDEQEEQEEQEKETAREGGQWGWWLS